MTDKKHERIVHHCAGQDFDTDELCEERETCARFIDLSKAHEIKDLQIISKIRGKNGVCGKRIEK